MIKGILALFRSRIIFNPMVLFGIITGFAAMASLEGERLHSFYTNYSLYLLMLFIAGLYVYFFKRTYLENGWQTDWKETGLTIVGHFLMFVVSFILSMLFVLTISFGADEEENYDLPEFNQIQQDLQNQQRELQKNYDAIINDIDHTPH